MPLFEIVPELPGSLWQPISVRDGIAPFAVAIFRRVVLWNIPSELLLCLPNESLQLHAVGLGLGEATPSIKLLLMSDSTAAINVANFCSK